MSAFARHRLLHHGLVLFVLADLLLLASFVIDQWLEVSFAQAWGLAALLALPLTMLAVPLVEAVLANAPEDANAGFSGDKIPGAGQ